jgi:lysophospholipase L1-like esterase
MRRLESMKPEVLGAAAMAALMTACGAPTDPNASSADASNGQSDSASGAVTDSGAGRDSSFADSGSGSDGSLVDSSLESDGGFVDSGLGSDGTADSGSESDGSSDSSSGGDVGSSDSGSADAGHLDGSLETGPESGSTGADSGGADGGSPESGVDAGHTHTGVWRITPIGDSITEDTCGPQLLSQELIKNGHTNFIFVGTETNNQSCSGAPNVESEGHGGYLVTDLLPPPHVATMQDHSAELPMWAANDKSDVLLMQFGTNDVWNGIATQTILEAYSLVLTDYRAVNPNVIMFVAQITPLNPAGCTTCEAGAETLNAAIPAWATSQSTAASPLYVVDVWSAFTASTYLPNSTYTVDGVHPNPAGSALVAQKWYDALVAQGIP